MIQRRSPHRHEVGAGLSPKDRTMKPKNTRYLTAQSTPASLLMALLFSVGLAAFPTGQAHAADDDAVDMIVELVTGSDNDMRTMAIQQIREKVPGKDATRRFVELLAKLPPDAQVMLIDALGQRGDAVARPAIVKKLSSKSQAIRVAAAGALSGLAGPADIPVLARLAATGSDPEAKAARLSLRKIRGKGTNAAMTEALKGADAKTKIELITALTDRNVKESLPAVVENADDSDPKVRLAVLSAFRAMANEKHTAVIVKRLRSAKDKLERRQAALALLAVCRRGKTKCAEAVIAGFDGADAATRILLMRVLTETGGPKSLNEIVARLTDDDKSVSTQALRALSGWPDRAAVPHLKKLAADVKNLRTHILAMRGLVRLAGPGEDRPTDLAAMGEVMKLATRKEEKVLVLGALGAIPTLQSLAMVESALDTSELAEDAGFVAVLIAEKISGGNKAQVRAVMQKVERTVKNEKTRARAKKMLEMSKP